MKENILVILTGVSCSGKSTQAKRLAMRGYTSPYNFTTRPPRGDFEKDEYVFVEQNVFTQLEEENRLAESVTYGGFDYGISKYGYEGLTYAVLEPNGRAILKKQAEDGKLCDNNGREIEVRVLTVYIDINKGEQKQRLIERGDSKPERIKRAKDFDTFKPTETCIVVDGTIDPLLLVNQIEDELNI